MKFWTRLYTYFRPVIRCRICHKPLHAARDRKAGIGAACAKKDYARKGVTYIEDQINRYCSSRNDAWIKEHTREVREEREVKKMLEGQ